MVSSSVQQVPKHCSSPIPLKVHLPFEQYSFVNLLKVHAKKRCVQFPALWLLHPLFTLPKPEKTILTRLFLDSSLHTPLRALFHALLLILSKLDNSCTSLQQIMASSCPQSFLLLVSLPSPQAFVNPYMNHRKVLNFQLLIRGS